MGRGWYHNVSVSIRLSLRVHSRDQDWVQPGGPGGAEEAGKLGPRPSGIESEAIRDSR